MLSEPARTVIGASPSAVSALPPRNVVNLHGSSPERRAARLIALAGTVRIVDAGLVLRGLHEDAGGGLPAAEPPAGDGS